MLKPILIDFHHQSEVERLHDVQERATGMNVDRPNLMQGPVLKAIGFKDERGRLRGGYYAEAVGEICLIGNSPEATDAIVEVAPYEMVLLKKLGLRRLHCFVPRALKVQLGPRLESVGFECADEVLSHYTVDLRRK